MPPPSGFSVAGMASTSTATHLNHASPHGQNSNPFGGSTFGGGGGSAYGTGGGGGAGRRTAGGVHGGHAGGGNPFAESLGQQNRAHYQQGYIMGASQSNNAPAGNNARADDGHGHREPPVVATKAKMNHAFSFSRGQGDDFAGMDSMFQSSRQRQALADEDAPPMSSVNDIPTEMHAEGGFQPRASTFAASTFARPRPTPTPTSNRDPSSGSTTPALYIIVFGYPADKYTLTVEYFKSLGDTVAEADPHAEISNCFKIGYRDAADAMRAVRKNGEVLGGSWMVGAKWADPTAAEALLQQPLPGPGMRYATPEPASMNMNGNTSMSMSMAVDTPMGSPSPGGFTPMVGTPIKLAPSSSVFRRGAGGAGAKPAAAPAPAGAPQQVQLPPAPAQGQGSPTKGMLGQVSDMIFGW
ncbi:Nucleoporin nup40 [Mycena chlorophos]|uniref:Nucleoporin nup40 n=1 Tax=Mycena chlorophos TaxID=658473 RepID=A0A8H6SJJ7_MYCCL|nr:Nucleoporin nup40 [Mycena chlorophos]